MARRSRMGHPDVHGQERHDDPGAVRGAPEAGYSQSTRRWACLNRIHQRLVVAFRRGLTATSQTELVVDTSVPARVPTPTFAKPVLIEDFSVSGVGAERHCTIDTNLVNYAGSLLPGRHYDREVTVVNHSDAAAPFRWVGHDPDAGLLVYPHEGILEPNGGSVTCVVELTPRQVQRFDAQMSCVVEHGPTLPLRVTAEVEGPEVSIAQSQVDFGLLQQHVAGDTYLLIRNQSAIAATWALEERRPQSVDGAPAPRSEIVFSVAEGELPPYAEVEVECTLVPSAPGPYRSNIACRGGGKVAVAAVPTSSSPSRAHPRRVDLGCASTCRWRGDCDPKTTMLGGVPWSPAGRASARTRWTRRGLARGWSARRFQGQRLISRR